MRRGLALGAIVLAGAAAAYALASRHATTSATTTTKATPVARRKARVPTARLDATVTGMLPAPLQDESAAALGAHAVLAGGLTAADLSSGDVLRASATSARQAGTLPRALHDSAVVAIGGHAYLLGGGDGSAQHAEILRLDGTPTQIGTLPSASSDQSAASIGRTAYVVGGYDGTRWLDTIVAWRPGGQARVLAHLPRGVRYAAVAAVGGTLVVAGGSLEDGTATAAVYAFTPSTRRVVRIGSLPAPTTHATAAALGRFVYVIGGRGAQLNTPTSRIVAIDPQRRRRIASGGTLPAPLSDAAAVTLGAHVVVFGGHQPGRTVDAIVTLSHARPASKAFASVAGNVYAHDGPGMLAAATRGARYLVYVPNSLDNSVDVIDQRTLKVVDHFAVGVLPQHVTPSWDLRTLYVLNDEGNSLTPIDPTTGKPGAAIPVDDPYNMYFTPDGRHAIVVAERLHRLDFRDPHSFALQHSLSVPCTGVDHMDFSADGSYLIASCEFSGQLVKVDARGRRVLATLTLPDGNGAKPQDVKLSPDGKVFYVADMNANGLWEIDGARLKVIGFLHTGLGVHGLYPSRDAKLLYATNRNEGTISVISFRTRKVVHTWRIPGGGSPDMGGVSVDGKVLWLSGRYNGVVYALSTRDGHLIAKIPVGAGPHGLCVWPQPGRYSLGHTGILR